MDERSPQEQREALLVALYDAVDGSTSRDFNVKEVGESIGLDPDRASEMAVVLGNSRYLAHMTFGGTGMLTPAGLREAERLKRSRPARPAPTPAPAPVFLSLGERVDLEAFVGALDRAEVETKLSGDDLLEYQADLDTARAQAKSPRPKRAVVKAAVSRLVEFVNQTGAGVAAAIILKVTGL